MNGRDFVRKENTRVWSVQRQSAACIQKIGREMFDIQDCVELAIRGLEVNIHITDEKQTQAYRGDIIHGF